MCGFAGWIDFSRDLTLEAQTVNQMADTMACRGPDDQGTLCTKQAAFSHRRLVVIDPEGGTQPMVRRYGDARYVITYNGEIYNMAELQGELKKAGTPLSTRSDTELILAAYATWGPAFVERLNGIFAFAIWDERRGRLFAARDRLGVKPLFFARRGEGLLLASELKGLLAHPAVEPVIDEVGLNEVLSLGPARTPGVGVFRDVGELKAGQCLLFSEASLDVWRYWKLESRPHTDDFDTTVETVRELLSDAIERQLVSDVPVCTLLSGGLDSSIVTAVAARAFRQRGLGPLGTFSVDFVGMERDFKPDGFQTNLDAPWIERMSSYLGTRHRNVVFDTPDLVENLPRSVCARDLPGHTDVDTSLLLFCEAIKREATVALSGEAADELFGGYPWCHREDAISADTFPWARRLHHRVGIIDPALRRALSPEAYVHQRYTEAIADVPALDGERGLDRRIREILYLNLTHFLPTLLDRKDRMSMASGLEVRVPFCDHRLVEYVWNIPWSMKSYNKTPKGVLRQAFSSTLPQDVAWRRKSPYPSTHNPAYGAAFKRQVLKMLDDGTSPLAPLLDGAAIRQLAREDGTPGAIPWFGQLMGLPQLFAYLMQIDLWMRTYKVRLALH